MIREGDKVYYVDKHDGAKKERTVDYVRGERVYFTNGNWTYINKVKPLEEYPLTLGQLIDTLEVGQVAEREDGVLGHRKRLVKDGRGALRWEDGGIFMAIHEFTTDKYRILPPEKKYVEPHEAIKAFMEGKTIVSECDYYETRVEQEYQKDDGVCSGLLMGIRRFTDGKWYIKE